MKILDDNKMIGQLTVGQFKQLMREIVSEELAKNKFIDHVHLPYNESYTVKQYPDFPDVIIG